MAEELLSSQEKQLPTGLVARIFLRGWRRLRWRGREKSHQYRVAARAQARAAMKRTLRPPRRLGRRQIKPSCSLCSRYVGALRGCTTMLIQVWQSIGFLPGLINE